MAEEALAWAVREGVTNVIRHSRARHCLIRLELDDDEVSFEVADDGIGMPGGETSAGSGLAGLEERVAAAGGTLETGPGPNGGFRLRVTLPVAGKHTGGAEDNGTTGGGVSSRSTAGDELK
jgi:two-component system sensor histidine kinase DesK